MKIRTIVVRGLVAALLSGASAFAAAPPAYKVEKSFGQDEIKQSPLCVVVDAKDRVHVLVDDGTVLSYDADGKSLGTFKSGMKPAPTTMTCADGKLYLFNTAKEEKVVEYRGKKVTRIVSAGIGCTVFDDKGAKVSELKLPEANSATDAHFIGKELAVADYDKQQIVYYEINGSEGKVARKITKVFRLCCGIFDFCPGAEPDTMVVANLGAFKVQSYKAGEKVVEFGQRGEKPDEFHGCCNPVNVASLADGSIISVEKSPTRVKIFDKEGKASVKVTGLTELVEGCSTIPIAVDSKGALYLASDSKHCIVKCVPGISDKPEPPEPKVNAIPDMPEPTPAMKRFIEKVVPLLEAEDFAKAKTEVEAIFKAFPDMNDDDKIGMLANIEIMPLMEKGDADAVLKKVDELIKAYPNSDLAKHADEAKASIKEGIEAMKAAKEGDDTGDMDEESAPTQPAEPKEK